MAKFLQTKMLNWKFTFIGAKLNPWLPETLDSVRVTDRRHCMETLINDLQFITKPPSVKHPLLRRFYHAWLIITNRAFAVQFTEDHLRLAGLKEIKDRS